MIVTFPAAARSRAARRSPRSINRGVDRSTFRCRLAARARRPTADDPVLSVSGQRVPCQRRGLPRSIDDLSPARWIHSYVAWLIAGGAPLPHIQARLRHGRHATSEATGSPMPTCRQSTTYQLTVMPASTRPAAPGATVQGTFKAVEPGFRDTCEDARQPIVASTTSRSRI